MNHSTKEPPIERIQERPFPWSGAVAGCSVRCDRLSLNVSRDPFAAVSLRYMLQLANLMAC